MFQQNQNQTRRSFFSTVAAAVASLSGGMAWLMGARPVRQQLTFKERLTLQLAEKLCKETDDHGPQLIVEGSIEDCFIDSEYRKAELLNGRPFLSATEANSFIKKMRSERA